MPVVAFLGPEASYTHQAALNAFSASSSQDHFELQPHKTFASIFAAVFNGSAQYGIIPVENSSNGPVAGALDLMARSASQYPSVHVVGETRVRVQHCLIGWPSTPVQTPPQDFSAIADGDRDALLRPLLKDITALYTHNQAWGQCSHFLKYLDSLNQLTPESSVPNLQPPQDVSRIDTTSTSAAAALIAESADRSPTQAAISSAMAAQVHNVPVLLTGLEDSAQNVTRFLIVSASSTPHHASTSSLSKGTRKGLIVFDLQREGVDRARTPGSLSAALGTFARHGLNLTSINARPTGRGTPWEYWFVVECEVPVDGSDGEGGRLRVERALQDLEAVTGECTCRGIWSYDESS